MDMCPICGTPLQTAYDEKQYIKENDGLKWEEQPDGERIAYVQVYYKRVRVCPNSGNNDFTVPARYKGIDQDEAIKQALLKGDTVPINPPCPNYHGGNKNKPAVVVETIEMIDN